MKRKEIVDLEVLEAALNDAINIFVEELLCGERIMSDEQRDRLDDRRFGRKWCQFIFSK